MVKVVGSSIVITYPSRLTGFKFPTDLFRSVPPPHLHITLCHKPEPLPYSHSRQDRYRRSFDPPVFVHRREEESAPSWPLSSEFVHPPMRKNMEMSSDALLRLYHAWVPKA